MPDTPKPEPTTQAGKALLDEIGQLVRTIRIAAKVPDSEIVPGATRQHFLERIAAIEAEAAPAARAEAEKIGDEDFLAMVHERDAANSQLAALRKTAAQEWEQRLARAVEVRLDMVLEAGRYLDLASPDAERRLAAALATVGGVGRPQPNGAARAILAALRADAEGFERAE